MPRFHTLFMTLLHTSETSSKCQTHQAKRSSGNSILITCLWQSGTILSSRPLRYRSAPVKVNLLCSRNSLKRVCLWCWLGRRACWLICRLRWTRRTCRLVRRLRWTRRARWLVYWLRWARRACWLVRRLRWTRRLLVDVIVNNVRQPVSMINPLRRNTDLIRGVVGILSHWCRNHIRQLSWTPSQLRLAIL